MKSPHPKLDPFTVGYTAFTTGAAHCDSPYKVESADYWRWHDGFYRAADDATARGEHVQLSRL